MLNNTKFPASKMILALPMIDFFFVIVKRYIIHKPKNLLDLIRINDTNHLHHQLITIGMSARQIVLIETSATLLIGLLAVLTTGAMNFFFLIFFAFLVITGTLGLHIISTLKQKNTKPKKESPESKYSY
jgi:UDP-GlcNAc:undecaprenyl-phosphate GlcNAc-1-phosphate transferase